VQTVSVEPWSQIEEIADELTAAGAELVAEVSHRRRAEISTIIRRIPAADRPAVVGALRAFADAAGEVPEQDWSLGWQLIP